MTIGFIKTRGTVVSIGTTSSTHLTDTYAELEGAKVIGGNAGKTYQEIDITVLTDSYKQTTKGIADGGSFQLGGILKEDPATATMAPGLQKLSDAADDETDPDVYNVKFLKPNGRTVYYKCRVLSFTVTYNQNQNVNEWQSKLMITQAPIHVAAA